MERPDMELVVTLSDAGSLSAAARTLHVAQPALSRRLGHLERELGGRLFDRGRHGARATAAGRVLVERSRAALGAITAAEADASAALAGQAGRIRLGTTPSLGAELLPGALARHRAEHPEVRFDLEVSGDSPGLRHAVATGALDVAVAVLGATLEQGLRVATSAPQPLVVALPPGHPLAERARVPRAELIDIELIALHRGEGLRAVLDDLFAELRAAPRITLEVGERELLIPFVAAGLGATVLPERFARQRSVGAVALRPLSPVVSRSVGAVVRSGPGNRLVDGFVTTLRHTWPEPGT